MAISSDISSFSPDDSPKLGRVCEITGAPFQPGDKVYSVLYEKDGQINRRDVCAAAWRTTPRPENTLAWWSTRVRADEGKDKKVKLAPNDALTALFVSLADKPGQEALRYTLALLLARRRVPRFDYDENVSAADSENANTIYVYSPRDEMGYYVPIVRMTEEQIAEVQERLVALIEEPSALDGVEQADGEDPSEAEEIARAAEAAAKATLGE